MFEAFTTSHTSTQTILTHDLRVRPRSVHIFPIFCTLFPKLFDTSFGFLLRNGGGNGEQTNFSKLKNVNKSQIIHNSWPPFPRAPIIRFVCLRSCERVKHPHLLLIVIHNFFLVVILNNFPAVRSRFIHKIHLTFTSFDRL